VTSAALAATCAPGSGSRAGCSLWNFGGQELLTTLAISSPYLAGNLRPSVLGFYAWSGSWLVQPGVDWTFWDPWRVSMRYNYIDGKGIPALGFSTARTASGWNCSICCTRTAISYQQSAFSQKGKGC